MGNESSNMKNESEISDEQRRKIADRQRRKLSIKPSFVGDVTPSFEVRDSVTEDEHEAKTKNAAETLHHATMSRTGVVPYNKSKVNQDRAVIKYNLQGDPDMSLFGVMDGHGEFGHTVAQFVKTELPLYLSAEKNLKSDPIVSITSAVRKLCAKLAKAHINIAFSGTTLVFAVKIKNMLYSANVGDSRCVLCTATEDGYKVTPLSFDHKPSDPLEKQRILAAGGRVETLPGPPGEDCGPYRVWLAEVDIPGLAMSRSVGDEVSQTVGVISVPDIITHQLGDQDQFIVLASDGVWEFISNEEAVDMVWELKNDFERANEVLMDESQRRWRLEEEVIDDITSVIVGFK